MVWNLFYEVYCYDDANCTHSKVRLNIGTLVFWSPFAANKHTIYTHFRVARPDQTFGLDLEMQDHTCTRIQD